jgi:hypothetical protein
MTAKAKEAFWAELEAIGEKEVRERVANRVYRDQIEEDLWSREWLLRREFNREFAFEQPKIAAQIELAKATRAAYARERAVIEATLAAAKASERQTTTATRIAIAALIAALIAVVLSALPHLK